MMNLLINTLKSHHQIFTLSYAEKRDNQTIIKQNDFMLFDILGKAFFDGFKLCDIPSETYLNTSSTPYETQSSVDEAIRRKQNQLTQ